MQEVSSSMTVRMRSFLAAGARLLALAALTSVMAPQDRVQAQGLFEAVITVNDRAITRYELDQRARMLSLFRAPGDPRRLAEEQLIEDRLKLDAAAANGITISDEDLQAGMEEFAQRADMTAPQMTRALAGAGVDEPAFREFVRAGVSWREVTRNRFASRVSVTDTDLDRAKRLSSTPTGVRVLISEIIMPTSGVNPQVVQERAARISQIRSTEEFSAQARRYSATASAPRGGRLDWKPLSELPPALQSIILGLAPGEVSNPLPIQGAIALFQLRDIAEMEAPAPEYAAIEYATYFIAGGRSEKALTQAARVDAETDTCDDLYGVAQGQPPEVLQRETKAPSEIPTDIAMELSKLDPGEISTALTRGDGRSLMVLMLCGRSRALEGEGPTDEELTNFIRNQRLESFAEGYLEQLRAEARILRR